MKFFYGYIDSNKVEHYVDVTNTVVTRFWNNSGIYIPARDDKRCEILGDPFPNILKHIMILDYDNNKHIFRWNKAIQIIIPVLKKQLDSQNYNAKQWWKTTGKFISDPNSALSGLLNELNFDDSDLNKDLAKQIMSLMFLREDNTVLEIGGNVGRTSLVISTLINDFNNHIVLESNPAIAKMLQHNFDINRYGTRVLGLALSNRKLVQYDKTTKPETELNSSELTLWKPVNTIIYKDLCDKFRIKFDTIVADCRGALYYILMDTPEILDDISTLIVENDFSTVEHKTYVETLLKDKKYIRIFVRPQYGTIFPYSYFEVWRKQPL